MDKSEDEKDFTPSLINTKANKWYNATKTQSDSKIWFEPGKCRITASKCHQVFTCMNTIASKANKKPDNLVR